MIKHRIEMDERAVAVDHQAGKRAYVVMSWLLVIDLGLRGLRPEWVDWNGFPADIPIVLLGGGVAWTWTAWRARILTRPWLGWLALAVALAAAAGAALGYWMR